MLGPGRYLLGVVELAALAGCAWLGAERLRSRLLPRFSGAPARLASGVLALALLLWVAELLGTVSLLKPMPYVLAVVAVGLALRLRIARAPVTASAADVVAGVPRGAGDRPAPSTAGDAAATGPAGGAPGPSPIPTMVAFLIAAIAVVHFASGVKLRLSTGMTGFDSTWYHGPFAAGFFQSGNTFDLHFIAPQFLAWFYPANGEIFHAVGMLAFGRDLLSPLLNLGWFLGCLVACWCIGRPYRVAPWSLALGAIALSVPALADQAGEARNDIVAIFFLLAAVAVALNAWAVEREDGERSLAAGALGESGLPTGALLVTGLAAGLAAGTKLNYLLPAAVLVVGLGSIAPRGRHLRSLTAAGLAALVGGGYWYLRNLVHAGNPLPWVHRLGPLSLPAPGQGLGGREAHSVLGYLTDGTVWSEWFLPALRHGLWIFWPLLVAAALAGLLLALLPHGRWASNPPIWRKIGPSTGTEGSAGEGGATAHRVADPVLAVAALAGLATVLAWLVAPTSASGPGGVPRGFESGLRYLAPALVVGLALLSAAAPLRRPLSRLAAANPTFVTVCVTNVGFGCRRLRYLAAGALVLLAVALGYPIQRHYLRDRYASPSFTTPGLDAAFAWARDISGARIATTSTRQYPLFGTDLSNRVQYVGEETPHGGFEAPKTCRTWRQELNQGHYDYVVTTRDRIEPGQAPYPPQARWTEGPGAKPLLRKPPTVVFQLQGRLDPSACK